MTPLIVTALAFVAVTAVVGMLMFIFLGQSGGKVAERLDTLTGRRKKEDEAASILRKSAFERDKKSLLEMFTPNFPSLEKIFMQADCNIRPSTLFGIGLHVFVWNHEDDSRAWAAPTLERYLEWWLSGQLTV